MLGDGIALPPWTCAFTDGNTAGGVGVVVLQQGPDTHRLMHEVPTTVTRAFSDAGIPGLKFDEAVAAALQALHKILAALAGLYQALWASFGRSGVGLILEVCPLKCGRRPCEQV